MCKCTLNNRGATLLEGLFAIVILSIGTIALLWFFNQMSQASVNDELTLVATRLASERVEQMVVNKSVHGYDSITTGEAEEAIRYNNVDYIRSTQTNYVQSNDLRTGSLTDTGYKRVLISVSWNVGTPQAVQMVSVLSDY